MALTYEGLQKIKTALWPEDGGDRVWAVLDGAQDDRIARAVSASTFANACLFEGLLSPRLRSAAPYLALLHPQNEFTDRLITSAWGRSWCIYVRSSASTEMMRRHLRTFLRVKGEDGKMMLFRFYDPRVINRYLPTCVATELSYVFGSALSAASGSALDAFFAEDETGTHLLQHKRDGVGLQTLAMEVEPARHAAKPAAKTRMSPGSSTL